MYLTYEEYTEMGGTLEQATFSDCEMEAETVVDWYTFNRLKNETEFSEDVKKCMYMLIKYINLQSQLAGVGVIGSNETYGGTAGIASQSNDGVSVSYNILSAQELMTNASMKLKSIINSTLSTVTNSLGQKVLYRGLYPGE